MKDVSSRNIVIFDVHEPQKLAECDKRPLVFWRVSMHQVDGVAGQVVVITSLWWWDNPPEILWRRQARRSDYWKQLPTPEQTSSRNKHKAQNLERNKPSQNKTPNKIKPTAEKHWRHMVKIQIRRTLIYSHISDTTVIITQRIHAKLPKKRYRWTHTYNSK